MPYNFSLHDFPTVNDAIKAGYRRVVRGQDKDISGGNSFGYDFQDADGNETVSVWISSLRRISGEFGKVVPMFPPKK